MIDNLEYAIAHAKEVAEMNRQEAEELREFGDNVSPPNQPYNLVVKNCLECAKEHEQLAEWLTELESDRRLLGVIRSIVWDNSLYDGIKIDKLRRLLSVYDESEAENE